MKLKNKIAFNYYLSKISAYEPGKSESKFLSKKKKLNYLLTNHLLVLIRKLLPK